MNLTSIRFSQSKFWYTFRCIIIFYQGYKYDCCYFSGEKLDFDTSAPTKKFSNKRYLDVAYKQLKNAMPVKYQK